MEKRKWLLIIILIWVLLMLNVWMKGNPRKNPIKIGVMGVFTGPFKMYGEGMLNGIRLGIEDAEKLGLLDSQRIELIVKDDKGSESLNGRLGSELVFEDKVLAIIGSVGSGTTHITERIALKGRVPMITSISTDPTISLLKSPYMFRTLPHDGLQGSKIANFMLEKKKIEKYILYYTWSRYGRGGAASIEEFYQKKGIKPLLKKQFDKESNYEKDLLEMAELNPEGIVIWGLYHETAQIVRTMKRIGMNVPVFCGDGVSLREFLKVSGQAGEGIVTPHLFNSHSTKPEIAEFVKKYQERYSSVPDSFSAKGYDTILLLLNTMKKSGADRDRLAAELLKIKGFQGLCGKITMDENGDNIESFPLCRISGGDFREIDD